MRDLSRRKALGLIAAVSVPPTVAVAAVPALSQGIPMEKADRLTAELSEVMNDYLGGKFHAVVYPSSVADRPVTFSRIKEAETPHQKLQRLSWEIAALLDGMDTEMGRFDHIQIVKKGTDQSAVQMFFDIGLPEGGAA